MLPEPGVQRMSIDNGGEVLLKVEDTLMQVLAQGNPVYLVLDLPGMLTSVVACFPAPTIARVYAVRHDVRNGQCRFVGVSKKEKHPIWTAPDDVDYRFGMRLPPFMFQAYLAHGDPRARESIANYVVLTCPSGFGGIVVRIFKSPDFAREWLEIHPVDVGNSTRFPEDWKRSGKIARFVPESVNPPRMTWQPEAGWDKHSVVSIPCKLY